MSEGTIRHSMLCPVCKVDLVMSERQGIEIDYCPRCRGVWLDRGELDKILERSTRYPEISAQEIPGRPRPAPDAPDTAAGAAPSGYGPAAPPGWEQTGGYEHPRGHGEHSWHRRHRKSWLEELFD